MNELQEQEIGNMCLEEGMYYAAKYWRQTHSCEPIEIAKRLKESNQITLKPNQIARVLNSMKGLNLGHNRTIKIIQDIYEMDKEEAENILYYPV